MQDSIAKARAGTGGLGSIQATQQLMWLQALQPLVTPAPEWQGAPGAAGKERDACKEGTVEDGVECLQVELIR